MHSAPLTAAPRALLTQPKTKGGRNEEENGHKALPSAQVSSGLPATATVRKPSPLRPAARLKQPRRRQEGAGGLARPAVHSLSSAAAAASPPGPARLLRSCAR